jgi:glycine/D-amino acid oxidase-like deaminating enzyme/nitrite reductase/ring-hydroxylating ferredoxin subunit
MAHSSIKSHSIWVETELPQFPTLDRDIEVDVVVVGAGLTGITAAYLLRQSPGVRVALIDRARVVSADSSRTTAHLTYVTDRRLSDLVSQLGKGAARAFWDGGAAAIDQIWKHVKDHDIDCDFRWVPGYLHAPPGETKSDVVEKLQKDAELARELGFGAQFVERVPLFERPGVRFANQAKFHPRKYLAPLLHAIPGEGSYVFENTSFDHVEENPLVVHSNGHRIKCEYLIIATHNPIMGEKSMLGATLFQTKLALYTSYVLGARVPPGTVQEALFWDTRDPYDYLRVENRADHQYLIFGGEDVKTGQEKDPEAVFQTLADRLHKLFPSAEVDYRWMGQVVETQDGLPYIGENASNQFIATGFCGNGFTLGTLAAMMARDRYLECKNPWFDLLRVGRTPFHGGLWQYVKENLDYPYYLLRGRLEGADQEMSPEELAKGEGRILKWQGQKVAAYRDEQGTLSLCSPVCTHLKCLVRWNGADQTWDCPCHGSRFKPTGEVLSGPAEEPLEKLKGR